MVANPAPLGLAAFGVTTFLLSSSNANLWHGVGGASFIGMALFYGGAMEILAAIMEFLRGDTLGATVFGSFGAFYMAMWYTMTHPALQVAGSLGVEIMVFAVATFVIWIAAMKRSMHLNLLFFLLTLTFAFLAYGNWAGGHSGAVKTGGWLGLAASIVAVYMAARVLINDEYERELLP